MTRDLVVIGDANPDLVLRGDVVPRFGQAEQLLGAADMVLGGSGSIMACGAARLGVPTAMVAHVGDDDLGRFVIAALASRGVDTTGVRRSRSSGTGLSVILSAPDDRAILTYLGAMTDVRAGDLDLTGLPDDVHVHASSFFLLGALADGLGELFRSVRARGGTTSLDTNWDPSERWAGVADVLPHTDVIFPNDTELLALTGCGDLDTAARSLTATGVTVAAKLGADGGAVWTASGETHRCPPPSVALVDTTGAGDSFDAGYLAAMLRGMSPPESIAVAVAAGSMSCRAAGGTAGQATWDEVAPA